MERDKASISRTLVAFEKVGLIERESESAGRRGVRCWGLRCTLTGAGRQYLAKLNGESHNFPINEIRAGLD